MAGRYYKRPDPLGGHGLAAHEEAFKATASWAALVARCGGARHLAVRTSGGGGGGEREEECALTIGAQVVLGKGRGLREWGERVRRNSREM